MLVLTYVKFKPANITHPCIEKDLLYTGMCQAFEFDSYCSCCRGILAWCRKTFVLACVKFKPASTIHPWIEEGLLYTKTCQAFSCCRAIFGGRRSIYRVKSQQGGCYSGCVWQILSIVSSYIVASCSSIVGVHGGLFKAIATKAFHSITLYQHKISQ